MRLWMPALLVPVLAECPRIWSGKRFQPAEQIFLARHSGDLIPKLSVLEKQQRWNGADVVLERKTLIFVHVYFRNLHCVGLFPSDFVEQRGDKLARSAPFRPEIYQHRLIAVYFAIKV